MGIICILCILELAHFCTQGDNSGSRAGSSVNGKFPGVGNEKEEKPCFFENSHFYKICEDVL